MLVVENMREDIGGEVVRKEGGRVEPGSRAGRGKVELSWHISGSNPNLMKVLVAMGATHSFGAKRGRIKLNIFVGDDDEMTMGMKTGCTENLYYT